LRYFASPYQQKIAREIFLSIEFKRAHTPGPFSKKVGKKYPNNERALPGCAQSRDSADKVLCPNICGPSISVSNATTFLGPNIVELRVLIDKNGKIVTAQPISGNPAWYKMAVKAIYEMK